MSDAPTSLLHDAQLRAATTRHEEMMVEARRIVDSGNDRGLVLRLTGGLAVRHYAIDLEFAERIVPPRGGGDARILPVTAQAKAAARRSATTPPRPRARVRRPSPRGKASARRSGPAPAPPLPRGRREGRAA